MSMSRLRWIPALPKLEYKIHVCWMWCPALPERVVQKLSDQKSQVQRIPALPENDMSKVFYGEFCGLPCLKESYQMSRPRWIPVPPKNEYKFMRVGCDVLPCLKESCKTTLSNVKSLMFSGFLPCLKMACYNARGGNLATWSA